MTNPNLVQVAICLFSYRLKTPQIHIVTRALHFSYSHVTLDKFALLNNFFPNVQDFKNMGLVYDTASAQVIQVVKYECKSRYHSH